MTADQTGRCRSMIGELPADILEVLLDTIPAEFTAIDEHDRIIAWNKGDERMFKRSSDILGSDIRDCHTEKSMDILNRMLDEMKEGTRDRARFWYDEDLESGSGKQKLLVDYYALRDSNGTYRGCFSFVRNIEEIGKLTGENRSLD